MFSAGILGFASPPYKLHHYVLFSACILPVSPYANPLLSNRAMTREGALPILTYRPGVAITTSPPALHANH
jgi:hypothetical protein